MNTLKLNSPLGITTTLMGLLLASSAAPTNSLPAPTQAQGICPSTFISTTIPCCGDGEGGFDVCAVTQTVTPFSVPDCDLCRFEYDVTVYCALCGTINVVGETGLVCGSRETHLIPCPDGEGTAVILKFLCGMCALEEEQH